MGLFSKITDAVNGAWDTVRGTVNNVSDAIYGVMPSPIQHVVDRIGQPIANAANSIGSAVDNAVPDPVQALIKSSVFPSLAKVLASTISAPVTLPAGLGAAAAGAAPAAAAGLGSAAAAAAPAAASAAAPAASSAAGAGLGSAVASGLDSGVGSALAGVLPAAAGYAGAIDYNQTMRDTNEATNATNMAIANQNLDFQRDLQNYNKNLQQTIFNREDNSYQRTVADMRAAGMSPLAMNGTNGAGEAIALGAMNNQYQHTPLSDYKSPLDALASINPIGFLSSLEDLKSKRIQNNLASDTYDYNKARIKAESLLSQYSQMDASRREKFNSAFNLNSSMSEKEKLIQIISVLIGTPLINKDGSPNMNLGDDVDKLLNRISDSSPVKSAVDALFGSSKSSNSSKPSKVTASSPVNERLKVAPRSNSSSKSSSDWREKRGSTWVRNR